jgi:hypothetical protein
METQQMMELQLARMNTGIKEHMHEMMARMETNQAILMAEREADKKKGRLKGRSTEKWQQDWKPFMTRQTPTRQEWDPKRKLIKKRWKPWI